MFQTFQWEPCIFISKPFSKTPLENIYIVCSTAQYYNTLMWLWLFGKFCLERRLSYGTFGSTNKWAFVHNYMMCWCDIYTYLWLFILIIRMNVHNEKVCVTVDGRANILWTGNAASSILHVWNSPRDTAGHYSLIAGGRTLNVVQIISTSRKTAICWYPPM